MQDLTHVISIFVTFLPQDLSQVIMDRSHVMGQVLGTGDRHDELHDKLHDKQRAQHRALYAITKILYDHLQKVRLELGSD